MGEVTMDLAADDAVEAILRDELAREARARGAVVPVLRHLLSSDADALVSDAILARVRGMIHDLAAQLLAVASGRDPATRAAGGVDAAAQDALAAALMADEALLAHCHALAAESLIAARLQQRHAVDPVLSPLLQELVASEDTEIAGLAMSALAAQSRFVQGQRRMELPLGELPPELFLKLVAQGLTLTSDAAALSRLRVAYDEATTRVGLLARLVAAMRRGALAGLALDHAGLALFASTLTGSGARVPREQAVLACHEGQGICLALLLRASGLGAAAIERQVSLVDPAASLPRGLTALSSDQAAVLARDGGAR